MINNLVIILSIIIFIVVIFIAAKPIMRGIEARQKNYLSENEDEVLNSKIKNNENSQFPDNSLTDELYKLKKLHSDGILSNDEFIKAKKKILD